MKRLLLALWWIVLAAVFGMLAGLALVVMALTAISAQSQESWWSKPAVAKCCSDADAVYADEWKPMPDGSIRAVVTGGGPRNHPWAPIGRIYIVPPDKVVREPGNPTGRALLFLAAPSNAHVFKMKPLDLWCFAFGPMT